MSIKINVSSIAAFIGEHSYKSQIDTFRQIAEEQGFVKQDTITADYKLSLIPLDMLYTAVNSIDHIQLEHNAELYVKQIKNNVIRDIMQGVDHLQVPDEIRQKIILCDDISKCLSNKTIAEFINTEPNITEVCNVVNVQRGLKLEEASTDKFSTSIGKNITDRNTKCYILKGRGYVLAGRCDGFTQDAVVETKTRRRYWNKPPAYDIIQLRSYMKLTSKSIGYLNEQFPDGTSRSTEILYDLEEWNRIETAIETALVQFWQYIKSS